MKAASKILLKKFNEGISRAKLIRKEIILIRFDPENYSNIKKINSLKFFYIKTIEEAIYNGQEFMNLSNNTSDTIRVAIDLDKYESILRRVN